jgi:membrane fusion protein, multidrug efflux system
MAEPVVGTERRTVEAPLPAVRPPRRRPWLALAVLLLVAAAIGAALWFHPWRQDEPQHAGRGGEPPQTVRAVAVEKGELPVDLDALGTVSPLATATVKPQVAGQLVQIGFREGQDVKAGDFLAQIDPRPYQIALEQAQATLAKDQALLKNAQVDLERYQRLARQDSIAGQQVDTQQALVRQYEATLQTDQAQIDAAQLNLTYSRVTAPVDGRIGLRQVDLGNYVTAGTTGIVVITQVLPISVLFTLPQDDVSAVLEEMGKGEKLTAEAFDRTNTRRLAQGTLETVDNQVDTTTGTVKLRAGFANDDEALFPNQFVNVRLRVRTLQDVPIVPVAAVQRGVPGTYVYVVGQDDTVSVRPITQGPSNGERVAVTAGLEPGERVVTDGADRLRDGAKIVVAGEKPAEAPDAAAGGHLPAQGAAGHRRRQPQ